MLRVGLTGGIGSGKSTVARLLAERGAVVIDADQLAREVLEPGSDGLKEVVKAFGDDVLNGDGTLNRAALAAKAFASEEARQTLNGITHPRIGALTGQRISVGPSLSFTPKTPSVTVPRARKTGSSSGLWRSAHTKNDL